MGFCLDNSPWFQWIELGEVESTNTFLRGYRPLQQPDITLVTAEYQTAGRGQGMNRWEAEAGKNLLFSLLLHPTSLSASQMFVLSEAMALSIREAVEGMIKDAAAMPQPTQKEGREAAQLKGVMLPRGNKGDENLKSVEGVEGLKSSEDLEVTVKWPNDVYVGDRKAAGILIENELKGKWLARCIIGCGVNVNQAHFVSDAPNPVSLAQLLGYEVERRFVLETIMDAFTHRYDTIQRGEYAEIHADYLATLYRRTGFHSYRAADGIFKAEITSVEPSGHLLLQDEKGLLRRYAFKEVAFV